MTKGILQKKREKAAARPKPKPKPSLPAVQPASAPTQAPTRASERTQEEERIRRETKTLLIEEARESGLTPELLSYFLAMPYMRIYRLTKPESIWLPRLDEVQTLFDFIKLVRTMREGAGLLLELRDKLVTMPADAGRTFFHPALWQTLRTGSTSTDEKRQLLTLRALKVLKERLQKEASK